MTESPIPAGPRQSMIKLPYRLRKQLGEVQERLHRERGRYVTVAEAIEHLIACEQKARTP